MASDTTTSVIHARDCIGRARFSAGVTGAEPGYGTVEIVRTTTTKRVADGDVRRVLSQTEDVEVLATLDAAAATHLIASLGRSLARSLAVVPPSR